MTESKAAGNRLQERVPRGAGRDEIEDECREVRLVVVSTRVVIGGLMEGGNLFSNNPLMSDNTTKDNSVEVQDGE